ncbi:MAG TPA: YciI family protein [Pyrinomonadaceae bacterium]|nr:YciI family protein [Pyrinomonadaceae bacterium]
MRVMVIIKANADSEAGVMPSEKILADMDKFNEELVNAGIWIEGEGLHPTSKAKRVKFSAGKRLVTDGPFAETREQIAGFWIWKVKSMDEAVEWVKRIPFDDDGGMSDEEIDIRPIFDAEDFGTELTPELQKLQERIRTKDSKLKE